ncbi:MAG: metal-dependent hydrolase [Syntrophobacterales bacterium GWC2_56_13]|nr:MAG: metal-dependent hydrolase [Syntrophobacterales bacterium GWC2_56_13]OHE19440.1 MAG: metal-dependent hydrolase [Syntrophobacterales bacterium GWF2_56_9]
MNIEAHRIKVSGITVDVVRKAIKNLHLGVYPPYGRVRVAAPLAVSDDAVKLAVISRLGWIKRQKAKFEDQPRQSRREMVTGESHYFLGQRYRLNTKEQNGAGKVVLRNKAAIDLYVRPGTDAERREKILQQWYREQLKALVPPLLDKWQQTLDVQVADWGIKKMKTKWGACNIKVRRIWLNLDLAKKPIQCLEYILVHELVHLLERHHNDRFTAYMDKFIPKWRFLRETLNKGPLGHETWKY